MRIDSSGNAIFTKSGGAYLQLKDASAVRGAINVETSDGLVFTTGSSFTERMRIDSSGRLGLGTTSPTEKLTVAGAITTTGALADDRTSTGAMDFSSGVTRFVSYGASGTGGIFAFRTASGGASSTERMRIDGSGNLLVSKTSSDLTTDGIELRDTGGIVAIRTNGDPLYLNRKSTDGAISTFAKDGTTIGSIGSEGGDSLFIQGGTSSGSGLLMHGTGAKVLPLQNGDSVDATIDLGQSSRQFKNLYLSNAVYLNDIIAAGSGGLSLQTDEGTKRLVVTDAGNLGIGTTSPSSTVDSHGAKGTTAGIPSGIINATDTTALAAGNGGAINFSGCYQTGGGKTAYASIEASKETSTHNEYGAALVFKTREDQGTQNEHMRVTSTGHVLLGTTTNQGVGGISFQHNASAGYNIQQNMDGTSGGAELYVFRRNSTQIGSINQSSTNAVTYNTSSDARLKDITGSSRGLDVINNLNPVAYNWKADNHADEGLIAQEVEELVPNAVNQDEDGYYSMDYSKLVTHLVKGMQEQQEQIESLKSEIANLKGE